MELQARGKSLLVSYRDYIYMREKENQQVDFIPDYIYI